MKVSVGEGEREKPNKMVKGGLHFEGLRFAEIMGKLY